jgi:hypothetical protein
LIFLSLLTILVGISCEKPDISDDSNLLQELYSNSNDTLLLDAHKYFLETDLSRNLMPGGPIPIKRKLVALIFLVNADSLQIPTNISITKLYVIKGSLIWISSPHDSNQTYVPEFKLDKVSTDGPEWETDIFVDVVAEVFNNSAKDKYFIIARQQKIEALY